MFPEACFPTSCFPASCFPKGTAAALLRGCISLVKDTLRRTLAACGAFRDWAGVTTEQEALGHIHFDALPKPASPKGYTRAELEGHRPFCIVSLAQYRSDHTATGMSFEYERSGKLMATLEMGIDQAISGDHAKVVRMADNALGEIIDNLCDLSGQAGYLAIDTIEVEPWARSPDDILDAQGDFVQCDLLISFENGL